jgi:hypothetical protein
MVSRSNTLAYLSLAYLGFNLSGPIWTAAETHLHRWYLTTPNCTVVRMLERMSAVEQYPST